MDNNSKNIIANKQGIFLLLGLQHTIIESQVILTCRALIDHGINIEIWSLCSSKKSYFDAQKQLSKWKGYDVRFILFRGLRSGIPFSGVFNAMIFGYKLSKYKKKPDFIHCRTEYPTVVALFLKPFLKFKVIWDSRGDSANEFKLYIKELQKIRRLLAPIAILQINTRLWMSKLFADKSLFVSDSLRDLYFDEKDERSKVIPCVADKKYFYFNHHLREKTRKKLFIQPNDIVLIYSGSIAVWQCIDETIELINDHVRAGGNHKTIILTPDTERFMNYFSSQIRNRIICLSVGLTEVNQYLNAADYAIFLRRENIINKVASPVKFAEYCLAGLPVVMTDAVDQAYNFSIDIGNLVRFEFGKSIILNEITSDTKRSFISEKSEKLLSREKLIYSFFEMYKSVL